MANVVFNRCCESPPEGLLRDGWAYIRCPDCGREIKAFPVNCLETSREPGVRYCPREIAEESARKWNEMEEVNGG